MGAPANLDPARKGFTLVEMLVVIVIIGILTSLITGAVVRARYVARLTVVRTEIATLDHAVQNYKNEYGQVFPSFANVDSADATLRADAQAAVIRHLRKAFPRYVPGSYPGNSGTTPYERFAQDVSLAYGGAIDPMRFDAASTLVFFLGGLPETPATTGTWVPAGFHADPTNPFKPGLPRKDPLFEFDTGRIVLQEQHYSDPSDSSSAPVVRYLRYYPKGIEAPYVYFKAQRISSLGGRWQYGALNSDPRFVQYAYQHAIVGEPLKNNCVPYRAPTDPPFWMNHDKYQIIAAGFDGRFGTALPDDGTNAIYRFAKTGVNFSRDDYDNLASFCERMLQDDIE